MKLYLVQHGLSVPEQENPERPLSREGSKDVYAVAEFLKANDIRAGCIWHSKKLRSAQTAKIIAGVISCGEITERNDLNPMDAVDKFPAEFLKLNKDLMIVGHLPFLQKLASLLLTGSEGFELISFKYSAIVCMEYQEGWRIGWFQVPGLLKA